MMNYIKSELYRISITKPFHFFVDGCTALLVAMNVLLRVLKHYYPDFQYATTGYAFSMVTTSFNVVLILTLFVGNMVFADEHKNRTWLNSIAAGYSRRALFLGKVIAGMLVSLISLIFALLVFVGSAYLLLENSGTEVLLELLRGIVLNLPVFAAGEIGVYALLSIMPTKDAGAWTWIGIIMVFPMICGMLGMKFEIFSTIKAWCLISVASAVGVTETGFPVMAYMTGEGMLRCLVSGFVGIGIFLALGLAGISRKEFK